MSLDQKRIEALLAVLEELASGKFEARFNLSSDYDEIDAIGYAVNVLAEEVLEARQKRREAEHGKRISDQRLAYLVSMGPIAIYSCSAEEPFPVTYVSENIQKLYGFEPEKFTSSPEFWLSRIHPEDAPRIFAGLGELFEHGRRTAEYRFQTADGSWRWIHDQQMLIRDTLGNPVEIIGTSMDTTVRRENEINLRLLSRAVESVQSTVVMTDLDGTIEYVNPKFTEVTGYSAQEAIGQNPRILSSGRQPDSFYNQMWEHISAGKQWKGEFCNVRKNGEIFWESAAISPIRNSAGKTTHYVAVKEDITERKRFEERLREAKEAAEAASLAKSTFLANMSHEIRTPMNAVLGFAQYLMRDHTLGAPHREKVEIIHRSGNHLLTLINDILEMSKIEAGRTTLRVETFDLHTMLNEIVVMFQEQTSSKGIALDLRLSGDLPRSIEADSGKVRQVLLNLLSNAVKFTEEGQIGVSATSDNLSAGRHSFTISVDDTGCGIAPEHIGKVFEAFEQSPDGEGHGGTGLGMAISRSFARLMKGDLTVDSRLGAGSRFTFTFEATVGDAGGCGHDTPPPMPIGLPSSERRRKVLIVDDVEENRELLDTLLSEVGFEVRHAVNGEDAIRVHEAWRPDLVLMDLRMPVMDGREAIRRLRGDGSEVAIIAITASAYPEDRDEALACGADGFLAKPFEDAELFVMINDVLGTEFEYAAVETTAIAPDPLHDGRALSLALDGVPTELLDELREAVVTARLNRLSALVERVAEHSPRAAENLLRLAQGFEYEALLAALGTRRGQ